MDGRSAVGTETADERVKPRVGAPGLPGDRPPDTRTAPPCPRAACPAAAEHATRATGRLRRLIPEGAALYERSRMLPRLLPVGPADIEIPGVEGCTRVVRWLERALRAERRRGRAGHWTYDLNRHIGLLQALVAERRRLRALLRPRTGTGTTDPPPRSTAAGPH